MTSPLSERPLLLICLATPKPHIQVLWVVQYVTPYFVHDIPEDGTVLAF